MSLRLLQNSEFQPHNLHETNTGKDAVFLAMTFMMMRADSSIKDANVV